MLYFTTKSTVPVFKISLFLVAITYFTFKDTISLRKQCLINHCITRYDILKTNAELAPL